MTTNSLPSSGRAIVKSVMSGDGVVLRGRPVNGPPPERILSFSNVVAPRLGTASDPSKEETGAFESREFLRKLLIGKEVSFKVEYTTTTNNRDFGSLTLAAPGVDGETNVSRLLVKHGWVKVKSAEGKRAPTDEHAVLLGLEAAAQAGGLGVWNSKLTPRNVSFTTADSREFLDAHKGKPIQVQQTAIVDQIRDANTIRVVIVVPDSSNPSKLIHQYININLTGIKAPVYRAGVPNLEDIIEPFSQEAKFFVESRLLQRDVNVVLEGVNTNGVFIASLIHKVGGSIAEALLAEGYASVVSWQVGMLKAAEALAKEKKLRIWKSFVSKASTPVAGGKDAGLQTLMPSIFVVPVSKPDAAERRIWFASLRAPPKAPGETTESGYGHEAKEVFPPSKAYGKTVHVNLDFIKPKENEFDERFYKALKALKGLHSGKEAPVIRFVDASESASKAKSFLSALQRNKTVAGVVEFASSGSRFRVWIPSQNIKITLVLSGVRTPKAARANGTAKAAPAEKAEPFGNEALDLANRRALQRDVEVSVEGIDKAGGFIGSLYIPLSGAGSTGAATSIPGAGARASSTENFAILLLDAGFATIHDYSASQSPQASQLYAAEKRAQDKRAGIWSIRDPLEEARAKEEASAAANGESDFKDTTQEVYVSEIGNGGEIHIQTVGPDLARLEKVMAEFALFYKTPQPALAIPPKVNEIVAAKFTADDQWYRARIREVQPETKTFPLTRIRALAPQFSTTVLPAQSRESRLAFLTVPKIGEEGGDAAYDRLRDDMEARKLIARVLTGGRPSDPLQVVLSVPAGADGKGGECLNLSFVADGVASCGATKEFEEGGLAALITAQDAARKSRLGIWRYGDFRDDD
ncbi:hypothetical protein BCR33DRAFT_713576 [Rhizoclosmatium globosum]|uniref:TNase-like domain-containing protein n=1 Tax=Rhizoclosmatium globosum TaxID=329046 RepID=A0A1Y2CSK1_9FUNG|nr:hypothetical protein BCR33DRAFT_713576 [Rhizoclosmatium globosum]|eukprot:ORY49982.1 hypothetical protein BCR33DRAFT_713576 [Rhizoclosmatium globosum]